MLSLVMGLHWTVIQSAAFVGMVIRYSQTDSLPMALSKTFDGLHPCSVCQWVKKGREADTKDEIPKSEMKQILLLVLTPQLIFLPLDFEKLGSHPNSVALHRSLAPPKRGQFIAAILGAVSLGVAMEGIS
ncbi:MAG: hypothetical protein NTV12_05765 [Verrucomicrobia bacterium]|nr:hypothetical protein [Verrucomicrobiota bacterium]